MQYVLARTSKISIISEIIMFKISNIHVLISVCTYICTLIPVYITFMWICIRIYTQIQRCICVNSIYDYIYFHITCEPVLEMKKLNHANEKAAWGP